MFPLTFRRLPPKDAPKAATAGDTTTTVTLENLVKQLPGEATAVYLTGFNYFKGFNGWLTVALVLGALALIGVRLGLKSSFWVIGTSLVSYLLWVYAIGDGPLQALTTSLSLTGPPGTVSFFIFVWTTFVTIAANNGWIK